MKIIFSHEARYPKALAGVCNRAARQRAKNRGCRETHS